MNYETRSQSLAELADFLWHAESDLIKIAISDRRAEARREIPIISNEWRALKRKSEIAITFLLLISQVGFWLLVGQMVRLLASWLIARGFDSS